MIKTKLFTLIELLTIIVVIGVLAAIVVPNISNFKNDSTTAAMQANIKNIETALTMYALENHGSLPVLKNPEFGLPEPLLLGQLHPDFIRGLPKVKGMKYWVDYTDKVWASTADSPVGLIYTTDGTLKWNETENAESFNVFKVAQDKVTGKASVRSEILIENVEKRETALPKLEEGEFYLVNSVDVFGLESPPVGSDYQGNILEMEMPETGLSQKEPFKLPLEMKDVSYVGTAPALTDGNTQTFYSVRASEDYLFKWDGELANRVFKVTYSVESIYGTNKTFEFLDKDGNNLPFRNATSNYLFASVNTGNNISKRTDSFVTPLGATQFKVHGTAVINLFDMGFVSDLSLPHPVENVQSTSTTDSLTLTWNPPTNASNFSRVAIYEGEKFLGYSSTGTFTAKPLYSGQEYAYSIEPISVVGNRGQRVNHVNRTIKKEIDWRGLSNASAFDTDINSSVPLPSGSKISWSGDLANRQITLRYDSDTNSSGRTMPFSFYDSEGTLIPAKMPGSNYLTSQFVLRNNEYGGTFNLAAIVPEGASYIQFADGYAGFNLFDITYGSSLDLPSKLTNVETTSTQDTITFKLNRPADVTRVAIIREGTFVAYTSTDTFTDKSLYAGKEYTYTFETYGVFGHRTVDGGSTIATTERTAIMWSGLSGPGAFDTDTGTYSSAVADSVIRWDGDLANRQLSIYYGTSHAASSYYRRFSFYDDAGNVIPSKYASNNQTMTEFSLSGTTSYRNYSVIVPEGATHIKFGAGSTTVNIYNLSYGSTLELPSKLTNVTTTSTTEAITLTFNRPADVTRVAVFRNGAFLDYTNAISYTDTSLYSDKEYTYSFETYNSSGHRTSEMASVKETTKRSVIVWSGLDSANAFDSSSTTYSNATANSVIRWEGDLANRQLSIYYGTSHAASSYYRKFSFYDDAGNVIPSKYATSNQLMTEFALSGTTSYRNYSMIVPEGATHIKFGAGSTTVNIYNLSYGSTLELPSKLTNVTTTSTTEAITLTFNRPADVTRVAVFRNGAFLNYTNTDTYTDTSLYSNRDYTYSFETYNSSGHRTSEMASLTKRTERGEIVWSGLDNANAFDSSRTTRSTATTNSVIRWEGDLANKQISMYYGSSSGASTTYRRFSFYDDAGNVIPSTYTGGTQMVTEFSMYGTSSYSTRNVIAPEGATHIKFGTGTITIYLYDVTYN